MCILIAHTRQQLFIESDMTKQIKYDEYRQHSQKLSKIISVLNSTHIQVDTIENIPGFEKGKRLFFEKQPGNTFRVSII